MIYTASGKPLKRAIGFIGMLVPDSQKNGKGTSTTAVASKSINPVRRRYPRNTPPVMGKDSSR